MSEGAKRVCWSSTYTKRQDMCATWGEHGNDLQYRVPVRTVEVTAYTNRKVLSFFISSFHHGTLSNLFKEEELDRGWWWKMKLWEEFVRKCEGESIVLKSEGPYRIGAEILLPWNAEAIETSTRKIGAKSFILIHCSKNMWIFEEAWSAGLMTFLGQWLDNGSTSALTYTT